MKVCIELSEAEVTVLRVALKSFMEKAQKSEFAEPSSFRFYMDQADSLMRRLEGN